MITFVSSSIKNQKILSGDDKPSELLPKGWNDDQNSYKLRYVSKEKIYIFHGLKTDQSLLINLLVMVLPDVKFRSFSLVKFLPFQDAQTLQTSSLVLDTEAIVKSTGLSSIDELMPDAEVLIKRVDEEIISPVVNPSEKKETNANRQPETNPDQLIVGPSRVMRPYPYDPYADPLRDIGRGDLDPFGRGGGSIFQPHLPRLPGMPPLPHLPRARYDPPNPFPRNNPDPDHFRPSGPPPYGYDDMFM